MRRGEVWTAAGGPDYAGKPRPVVIVQSDHVRPSNSITTCGFTTDAAAAPDIRPIIEPSSDNGLSRSCAVMIDKIMTQPRSKLGKRIGQLSAADMLAVDQALLLFLGFTE